MASVHQRGVRRSQAASAAALMLAVVLAASPALAVPRTPEFSLMPESRTGEGFWETSDTTPRIAGRTGSNARLLLEVTPSGGGDVLHSEQAVADGEGGFQFQLPEMPDGAYILTVTASKSGQQTWSDRKVTIDTVAPTEPFRLGFGRKMETPAPASVTTRDILVEFSYRWPSGWPAEGEAYLGLYRDGATRIEPFREVGRFSFSLLLPENETHTYRIVNVDPAGNVGPASEPLTVAQKIDRTSIDRIDLAKLPKSEGIALNNAESDDYDFLGEEAAGVGDVNGDGFDDVALASSFSRYGHGLVAVVFGGPRKRLPRTVEVTELDGRNGVRVMDFDVGSALGGGGDVNGDGFDDIVIGSSDSSSVWILFGRRAFPAVWNESHPFGDKDAVQVKRSKSAFAGSRFGRSVAIVGDMNGDGTDDFAIGDDEGKTDRGKAGVAYVLFGRSKKEFPPEMTIRGLDGRDGFRLEGEADGDAAGADVAAAGDFNGDGFADLLVSASYADPGGRRSAGTVYVVFGRKGGFPDMIRLAKLDGVDGFAIPGPLAGDKLDGKAAGDVNGDGIGDIVLRAAVSKQSEKPRAFVVFGQRRKVFPKVFDLQNLKGDGFRIRPAFGGVSGVGDLNADGFDDLMLSGESIPADGYILLGQRVLPQLVEPDKTKSVTSVRLKDPDTSGPVAPAGDFDGDGFPDALLAAPVGSLPGSGYVLFGQEWKK
jgi:hypothetical protein